jgi:type I restriction enzyme M protein
VRCSRRNRRISSRSSVVSIPPEQPLVDLGLLHSLVQRRLVDPRIARDLRHVSNLAGQPHRIGPLLSRVPPSFSSCHVGHPRAIHAIWGVRRAQGGHPRQGRLDLFRLRNESLEDSASLPDPHLLAQEIADDFCPALAQLADVLGDLG